MCGHVRVGSHTFPIQACAIDDNLMLAENKEGLANHKVIVVCISPLIFDTENSNFISSTP